MTPPIAPGGADGEISWRHLWEQTAAITGRTQARWLCEVASGADDEFVQLLDEHVTERCIAHLDAMLARLATGEPLQYVLGRWGFRRLDLMVDRRVLIPRPETELLVEHALVALAQRPRPAIVADLGTGSGAIGLAIADESPVDSVMVWLTDVSTDAIDVARANAAGLGRKATAVRFTSGSWFEALPEGLRGRIDVAITNPPYIADGDPELESIVHGWEPHGALYGGADGLDHVRTIAAEAVSWLSPGGTLLMEIGHLQGPSARGIAESHGWSDVTVHRDLSDRHRVLSARLSGRR